MKNFSSGWLISIGLFVLILVSCKDNTDIGMELLPSADLLNVRSKTEKSNIRAYTNTEDSVRTDETARSLLGSFNDSVFGNTTINFAAQFRLSSFPRFRTNPVVDSVFLFLYYRLFYGDTSTVQKIKIYELNQPLDIDADYYSDKDLKSLANPEPLATHSFKPKIALDSVYKDTVYQLLKINLGTALGIKLVAADSSDMVDNDAFLNYFRGLYIETEKITGRGGILMLETISNNDIDGSALAVYYHNNELDTTYHPYIISKFSARVNSYSHDYSQAVFYNNLNKETVEDSLIYIQPTGGLKSKIYIDYLSNWKDSAKYIAVNKAEMVFQVDTIASDIHKYPPPNQLLFTFVDKNGGNYLPVDYAFSPSFYGGYLLKDYTYRFNITQLFEQIIDGTVDERGFYLTTVNKNSEASRVVLKGSTSKTGIKFNITYTKLNR